MRISEIEYITEGISYKMLSHWLPKAAYQWIVKHLHKNQYKEMVKVYSHIANDPLNKDKKPMAILRRAARTVGIDEHEIEDMFQHIMPNIKV